MYVRSSLDSPPSYSLYRVGHLPKHFRNDDSLELTPGMIFTIEPMLTEGSANCTEWSDDWTVATDDKGRGEKA